MNHYTKKYIGAYYHDFPQVHTNGLETQIEYKTNLHGFRSPELCLLDTNNYNILYAGCSNTFGEGLPEEYVWTSMLTAKISYVKDNVKYFNIGYGAASIHSVIRNVLAFIENYGNPNIIFMHLPRLSRNLYYSQKMKGFSNTLVWDKFAISDNKTQKDFNNSYVEENQMLLATTLLFLLERLCKESKIKLIWSTWDSDNDKFYSSLDFRFFMPMGDYFNNKLLNQNNIPYWEIAADKSHPGSMWSTQFAQQNFEEFLRRGYDE